jgi:hypothetical protein
MQTTDQFVTRMFETNPDFVFTVTRDFVRQIHFFLKATRLRRSCTASWRMRTRSPVSAPRAKKRTTWIFGARKFDCVGLIQAARIQLERTARRRTPPQGAPAQLRPAACRPRKVPAASCEFASQTRSVRHKGVACCLLVDRHYPGVGGRIVRSISRFADLPLIRTNVNLRDDIALAGPVTFVTNFSISPDATRLPTSPVTGKVTEVSDNRVWNWLDLISCKSV